MKKKKGKKTEKELQEKFNNTYNEWRSLYQADHILSPCHPLKIYKRKLFETLRKEGDDVMIKRLDKAHEEITKHEKKIENN